MATQAAYRAAAIGMVEDCAANANVKMQTYPARPMSLFPPTGFIDEMGDDITPLPGASNLFTHVPEVSVLLVWGTFDSAEAAAQRDAFVDAYHDWVRVRPHEAGAATLIGPRSLRDIPVFNPDWGSETQQQTSYYATRVVLEGFATD